MTRHAATARQTLSGFALALTCLLATSACIYDAPPPSSAELINERTTPVTLTFDGAATEPQEIGAREGRTVRYAGQPVKEGEPCVDVRATVTDTATGQVLGTVDPPICDTTTIHVREDGTVEAS